MYRQLGQSNSYVLILVLHSGVSFLYLDPSYDTDKFFVDRVETTVG